MDVGGKLVEVGVLELVERTVVEESPGEFVPGQFSSVSSLVDNPNPSLIFLGLIRNCSCSRSFS